MSSSNGMNRSNVFLLLSLNTNNKRKISSLSFKYSSSSNSLFTDFCFQCNSKNGSKRFKYSSHD